MKRKVNNFITNFKESESKLIKYIKENNVSEFTKYMREELVTLGFYEYGLGFENETIFIELPAKNNLLQILINNYLKEMVENAKLNLIIYPYLRKKENRVIEINGNSISLEESKFFFKEVNGIEKDITIYHPEVKSLREEEKIELLYAILDSKFDEFEQLFNFNEINIIAREIENEMISYNEIEYKLFDNDRITFEKWKETYYLLEEEGHFNLEYRGKYINQALLDPRINIEDYYNEEKINENIDLLSLKFTLEDREEVEEKINKELKNSVIKLSQTSYEFHIIDYLVFDLKMFKAVVKEVEKDLKIEIQVYDNYTGKLIKKDGE